MTPKSPQELGTTLRTGLLQLQGMISDRFRAEHGEDSATWNNFRYFVWKLYALNRATDFLDANLPCFHSDPVEQFAIATQAHQAIKALQKEVKENGELSLAYFNTWVDKYNSETLTIEEFINS